MSNACLHVVALQIRPQLATQLVRRHRLANGANIVTLALHGEEHSLANCIRLDALASPLQPTARECMVLKDELDRLEVEFGREMEQQVSADDPSIRAELLLLSPSFLVPCLTHDGLKIWDTLAIAEYSWHANCLITSMADENYSLVLLQLLCLLMFACGVALLTQHPEWFGA